MENDKRAIIESWTEQKLVQSMSIKSEESLMDICRENFEHWETVVIPSIKKLGSAYDQLAELFHLLGYKHITRKHINTMLNRIRKEKGIRKIDKGVKFSTPSKSVTPPALKGVTSPSRDFSTVETNWSAITIGVKAVDSIDDWKPEFEDAWNHTEWLVKSRNFPDKNRDTWMRLCSELIWDCRFIMQQRRKKLGLPV